ncbi:MAG: hypothetical protein JW724_04120 [Candidatus Altiarchaeota archaeon]|nr:hypothetical protein [Candidatus Altiarchaeota archaeon]
MISSLFEKEEVFVVVDRDSNRVLTTYQYDYALEEPLVRTESYDSTQRVVKTRNYTFDDRGYVSSITEEYADGRSRVIEYVTREERDDQDRLIKVVQESSLGETFETFYGYDETGKLRGTVVRTNNDSLMMKDYDEEE